METSPSSFGLGKALDVSVPLRGLIMWKPRRLKHKLGAESRDDFGGPLKKPYFRLRVKHKLKLMKR